MKMLAVILIIVAVIGIILSIFPGFSARNTLGGRQFNNTQRNFSAGQQNFNPTQENLAPSAFGFSQISLYVRAGLWIVVAIIAILLMREPKKK